ncbi:MAG: DUF7713 domain-containing protein [Methylocystis sp.]
MRLRRPRLASPEEVRISREGEWAIIEYADPTISSVRLRVGSEIEKMTDAAILALLNLTVDARDEIAAQSENRVIEVLLGRPQIKYFEEGDQWVPRAQVLRCHLEDDDNGKLVVYVDDEKLDLQQFGRMLTTYAGWGMRIYFVDDDAVAEEPTVEVKDPED